MNKEEYIKKIERQIKNKDRYIETLEKYSEENNERAFKAELAVNDLRKAVNNKCIQKVETEIYFLIQELHDLTDEKLIKNKEIEIEAFIRFRNTLKGEY